MNMLGVPWLSPARLLWRILFFNLIFLFRLFSPQTAISGYIENPSMGPKANAMGCAFAGLADDGFALFYNPAGLAQIKGKTYGNGIDMVFTQRDYRTGGTDLDDQSPLVVSPRTVFTADFGLERVTFGFGAMVSFAGIGMVDEFKGEFRYSAYNNQNLVYPLFLGTGYKVNDKLYVGGVLQIPIFNKLYIGRRLGDGFVGKVIEEMVGLPVSEVTVNGIDDGKLEVQTDREFPTGLL